MRSIELGKLVSVHGISPSHLQKAVFIAVLSFLFFLAMMFAFYIRQSIAYFLLSTAFLIVYLFTMFGIVIGRRRVVQVFDRGLLIKGIVLPWNQIAALYDDGTIDMIDGSTVKISAAFHEHERLIELIKRNVGII